jgi:predicted HTH transcriptional regulator
MTPDELRERILQGEDLHTDFKSGRTPDRTELAKDIVCFANTDGGQLIFGVSDDGSPHQIVGFKPERREEIPSAALREAVVNALVHRDYTIPGPVRVFALADRVEIHTPGRPPNSVDAGAMRAGVHVTRNPHLYSRVADAGLVTRAGTGVRRMIRLVREASGRDIDILITEAEVVIVLPRAPRATAG